MVVRQSPCADLPVQFLVPARTVQLELERLADNHYLSPPLAVSSKLYHRIGKPPSMKCLASLGAAFIPMPEGRGFSPPFW